MLILKVVCLLQLIKIYILFVFVYTLFIFLSKKSIQYCYSLNNIDKLFFINRCGNIQNNILINYL